MTSIHEALGRLWDANDHDRMLECDGRWASWGSVRSLTERIDRELTAAGCRTGGRVAVVLGNRMESVAALIAIFRGGRTLVTISPLQPPDRLSDDLAASRRRLRPCAVERCGPRTYSAVPSPISGRPAGRSTTANSPSGRAAPRKRVSGDPAVAIEMLTSGTTGAPKRIPLTRAQLEASLASALQHNDRADAKTKPPLSGTVGLVTLPIVHIGGLWSLLQSLVAARPIAMLDRFTRAGLARRGEAVSARGGRTAPGGHAIGARLRHPARRIWRASVPSMRVPAAVDPALVDAFFERYGIPILVVYGATEFSGAVAGWTVKDFHAQWADKKGSVGRAFPGVAVAGRRRGRRGPRRQRKRPAAGRHVRRPAEPDTGSRPATLAHLDADGFLYIDGRADDVIVRGGFKVSPETVVRALRAHPAVADAAVAPVPDQRLGQIPVAAVELQPAGRPPMARRCGSTAGPR